MSAKAVDFLILINGVQRPAQALSSVIEGQRAQAQVLLAITNGGFAAAQNTVKAHAPGVILAKTTPYIHMCAKVRLAGISGAHTRQRLVVGTFGKHIDAATDTAIGRNAAH